MSKNVGGHPPEHHLRMLLRDGRSLVYHDNWFMMLSEFNGTVCAMGRDLNDMIADYYARRARVTVAK